MIDLSFAPNPLWLAAAGAFLAAAVAASYAWTRGRSRPWQRLVPAILRCLTLATVVFCLLGPVWVEAIKRQHRTRTAVLLDTSRSMSIRDLPEERFRRAKAWLDQDFRPAIPADTDVQFFTFDESLAAPGPIAGVKPEGNTTGLAEALEALLSAPADTPITSVLVCSDGIENMRKDPEAAARIYRRKGIPIHTLLAGTTNEMRDVIMENVQAKRTTPNKAPTKVTVSLRAPGLGGQTVPVQILREGQVVAAQDVRLTGGEQKVQVEFTPRQKGFQVYEARIPARDGEWLASNNRRLFGLDVIDPVIRVIYMEGTPQQPNSPIPEWKYLKSALESDPDIKVTTLYRQFGANGKELDVVDTDPETGEKIYPVEHARRGFPKTLAQLLEHDVVIHSDIRKESFTGDQLKNMARLVEEFGGGFVMIGGNSAFGKGGYHKTIIDRIIPVAMQQDNDSQAQPFAIRIPPMAWQHPIIAFGRTQRETELIWTTKFPPLYGCNLVNRAKPGAVVLGLNPESKSSSGFRLVLAVQSIGRGRTMAFTSDTTRTWGKDFETLWGEKLNANLPLDEANCDSRYYRQFWVNAVRWLAAGRIGRTNNAVTLELAQSYCAPKEKVRAAVRVQDKNLAEITDAKVRLLVAAGGKTNVAATPAYDAASHAFVAELTLPAAGEFTVSAAAARRGVELGDDRQLLVCEETDREMRDLRARSDLMAALSAISGGESLSLSNPDPERLAALFRVPPPAAAEYKRSPIWDRGWVLGAIVGLLSLEWGWRRWIGMA